MKKALIGIWIAASSLTVWASCVTHSVYSDGKYVTCTTCCYGNNCNTNCF